jgi:hypothetical protein
MPYPVGPPFRPGGLPDQRGLPFPGSSPAPMGRLLRLVRGRLGLIRDLVILRFPASNAHRQLFGYSGETRPYSWLPSPGEGRDCTIFKNAPTGKTVGRAAGLRLRAISHCGGHRCRSRKQAGAFCGENMHLRALPATGILSVFSVATTGPNQIVSLANDFYGTLRRPGRGALRAREGKFIGYLHRGQSPVCSRTRVSPGEKSRSNAERTPRAT